MRFLITGGAGFVGSHLADALLARGDRVIVLDDLSTGSHSNIRHLRDHPNFEFVFGTVVDPALVTELTVKVDAVFHLAAAVGVKQIVDKTLESLLTNIRGSEVVLDAANAHGRKVLITSTSEIYGKSIKVPFHEDDDRLLGSPLVGRWSYSTSKAVDEILAHAYYRDKGLPTVIVRLFNTVGPRQTGEYGMVIPRFIKSAIEGRDVIVYGDGKQSRCFAYVGDVVEALIALMESREAEGLAINIGSTDEITIRDLAELVVEITNSTSNIRMVRYKEVYESGFEEMPRRVPDIGRAQKLIGFEPRTSLRETLDLMVADAHTRRPHPAS